MAEETEPENFENDLFKVVNSDDDLLKLLREQTDEFKFLFVKFNVDIDLYTLLSSNPIPGIILLARKAGGSRPDVLRVLSPVFDCTDIQFDKPVSFFECCFPMPADFKNVIFKQGFNLRNSKFEKGMSMMNVSAERQSTFGFRSDSSVMMLNCNFAVIDNQFTELSTKGNFHLENTSVGSGLDLSRCKVRGQLNLIGMSIRGNLDLSQSAITTLNLGALKNPAVLTELQDLNIAYTEFGQQVRLSQLNINGKVSGQATVFRGSVFLTNVNFNHHVYLTHSVIDKPIMFENVIAKGNFSFYGATLDADLHFNDIDLSSANVSFTGSRINGNLWLGSLLHKDAKVFTGTINFQGAMVAATSTVRIFNINNIGSPTGEIDFSNALVKGFLDIRNVYVKKITFNGTVVPGNIQDNSSLQSAIADRETARLLKHEARRINNTISSLAYNKIEMKLHAKTVSIQKFADWSMLRLNLISNNYGTNWIWGAMFTFGSGLLCYSIFNIAVSGFGFFWQDNWNFMCNDASFWSGFINYFWLPTGFNELTKNGIVRGGISGGLIFVTGKILIAYGIYQTVAAFRKYT